MKIDGVFSGGGVKAFAFIGALQKLEEHNYTFVRVAGTSSGAIVAGLLAAGYRAKEIEELFAELNLKEFLDTTRIGKFLPFIKWFSLYFTMGLYKGAAFEKWLYHVLGNKGIYTFGDLPADSLKVIASDITLGRLIVIPDDLESLYGIKGNEFPVSTAIRMSASLPYLFVPVKFKTKKYKKSVIVDGGLLSNLPIWVFDQQRYSQKRPLIGLKLSESISRLPSKKISNALDMIEALITTMMKAHDARYIRKNRIKDILFLPVKDVELANLKLSDNEKKELIQLGKEHTSKFLKQWP